ncbi:glutathione S-transferase N-terminal domain-containing protein [Segnochrobactraceae bacterium EtOH-i3]
MTVTQTAPIELFFWPTPNGFKITLFLEELDLPYKVHFVNIGKGDQFLPEFLKIAPNNRMPAIIDPEGPGGKPISIFESGAILLYLARKFGAFYPADDARARVEVEEWLMWQMGGFGPMLGQNHHFNLYAPEKLPYAQKRYIDESRRLYGVLDRRLDGRDFVCGAYSIADMAMFGWARGWKAQSIDLDTLPNVKRWLDAIAARPATARALAVGADTEARVNLADDADGRAVLAAYPEPSRS